MKKIRIIGGAGSGKSYLAKKLSEKFNISHYDLDEIFWDNNSKTYGVKAKPDVRDSKLLEITNK